MWFPIYTLLVAYGIYMHASCFEINLTEREPLCLAVVAVAWCSALSQRGYLALSTSRILWYGHVAAVPASPLGVSSFLSKGSIEAGPACNTTFIMKNTFRFVAPTVEFFGWPGGFWLWKFGIRAHTQSVTSRPLTRVIWARARARPFGNRGRRRIGVPGAQILQ